MSEPHTPTAAAEDTSSAATQALTERLIARHFVQQDTRPPQLGEIELQALDPALRCLLFTDGTVTRTLEAQSLAQVTVDVVAQSKWPASEQIAAQLGVGSATETVQRRVTIAIDGLPAPSIWAESHILPARLPDGFIGVLDDTPDGIGESLQQIALEGWREMLWFGLDSPPAWDPVAACVSSTFLTRLYRVVTQGEPALLISESFAMEARSGSYYLPVSG